MDDKDEMQWVMLVKMGVSEVKFCRPDLAAGGGVSRAKLRQGKLRETASWFAAVRFWPELFMCETDVAFLSARSRTRRLTLCSATTSSEPSSLNSVDFFLLALLGGWLALHGVHDLSLLAQVHGLPGLFAELLQRGIAIHGAQRHPDVLR